MKIMVSVTQKENKVVFDVLGWHKIWALRSKIEVDVNHIKATYLNTRTSFWSLGLRMPGTRIPGLITAGRYWTKDKVYFCDIVHPKRCIVVELENEPYTQLIVEVKNPEQAIQLINHAGK